MAPKSAPPATKTAKGGRGKVEGKKAGDTKAL